MSAPLLRIDSLTVDYVTRHHAERAVHEVSLEVEAGQVVALVGESGSGKTTLASTVAGQLPATARVAEHSRVDLAGVDVVRAARTELDALRGSVVGFVPQDPRRSLHPLKRVGDQIAEVLLKHRVASGRDVRARVIELLEKVGIDDPPTRSRQYPHEFSGGMQQRALIAIAIAARPGLIVADEPTSALDVTVQKQILTLLTSLVADDGVSVLLVTHDLALAAEHSDVTHVMRSGVLVESRPTAELFERPAAEYTRALLRSSPQIRVRADEPRQPAAAPQDIVLRAENVTRRIRLHSQGLRRGKRYFTPVDDVSFVVRRGATLAIVGESGAGKTSLGRLALGLDRPDEGRVVFEDNDIAGLDRAGWRGFRRGTHLIPQNPAVSFNPLFTVAQVIAEPLAAHGLDRAAVAGRVTELLEHVNLPASVAGKRALELSGGQQQRVAIARAVSLNPRLIVCDEPTSALDVTVQARIIDLLHRLQAETQVSFLFISHDLALVSEIADDIVVLRRGRVAESGRTSRVLAHAESPYTRTLLDAVPGRRDLTPSSTTT